MIERMDDLGQKLRLDGPARRIVCLVPSITETLFALGAGPYVVGITDYCIHPQQEVRSKPRIGGTKNVAVKKIVELNPDLVIANAEENRKHHVEQLREAGLKVFVTYPRSVDQCLHTMEDIAALTGTEAAAGAFVRAIGQARVEARPVTRSRPQAVFCPIWKNPYMTINRDTFVDSIIREAGGCNIFADSPDRYPRITLEDVGRRRPDIVILPTEPYHFVEADKADFEACGDSVPAVRNGRIHIVEGELLSWYGPRVARALRELAALFRPCSHELHQ